MTHVIGLGDLLWLMQNPYISILLITSLTIAAHIRETSHLQSATAGLSTLEQVANQIAKLDENEFSNVCSNKQKNPPDFVSSWFQSLLAGFLQEAELRPLSGERDLLLFLEYLRRYLIPELLRMFDRKCGLSFWVSLQVKYTHPTKSLPDVSPPFLHTTRQLLLRPSQVFQILHDIRDNIQNRNEHLCGNRSGMGFVSILKTRFKVVELAAHHGSGHRDLLKFLADKHAIINVQNKDKRCFVYALLSALHHFKLMPQRAQW